jgi:hypothetical protein
VRVSDLSSGSLLSSGSWRAPTYAAGATNPYVLATSADGADLRAAASPGDLAVLKRLLGAGKGSSGSGDLLSDVTNGQYGADNLPDTLAVRSGPAVTPLYAGGYDVVGYADAVGSSATFFGTGGPGEYAKGVAITYGSTASATSRDTFTRNAMSYLTEHLIDSQDADGRWSRPTLDVRV